MAPAVRLLVLAGLLGAARGLRVIHSPDFSCSQPGMACTVRASDCLDVSWLRRVAWTPTAPATMEVTAGIGRNETGHRVPVLMVNWTASVDASIRNLQGAEIAVLEISSGRFCCVQFEFSEKFDRQRDPSGQAWKFFYNMFEVFPGNDYHVSVQHLPKEEIGENRREKDFKAPGCTESGMMTTWTCCKEGYCWSPNTNLEFSGDQLIVTFTPRSDALKYGVLVDIVPMQIKRSEEVILPQGATAERVQVIIPNPVPYEPCWYNVTVWPQMEECDNDCVRQWYAPRCPPTPTPPPPPTPEPPVRVYVWLIVAVVTVMTFAGTAIFFWRFQGCFYPPGKPPPRPPSPGRQPPPLKREKVWLVYSADHERYVNVVLRLGDFLRSAWGLDVVLDRHQTQMIGIKGSMAWLGYQKAEIERTNGTILILCSKGVQAKWQAMQTGQRERILLPEDAAFPFGDLFTPALANILPDFHRGRHYDRYLVAYFSGLSDAGDIPAPLEICPPYSLTENLELLLFRIQRMESHQPNVQYNVDVAAHPSYQLLVKAVEQCRTWQETHLDWLGNYILAEERPMAEDEVGDEGTRRIYPRIRQPETSASIVSPQIIESEPLRSVNPSLVVGCSGAYVVPQIIEEQLPVAFVKPSLNMEALATSYRQQPFLVNVDESVSLYDQRLEQMDLAIPMEQDGPMEDVGEAQRRIFCQSLFDHYHEPHAEDPRRSASVDTERPLLYPLAPVDLSLVSDHEAQSEDLGEAQKRFLFQSNLVDQPGDSGGIFDPLVEEDVYDEMCEPTKKEDFYDEICVPDQNVNTSDLMKAQHNFFLQTIRDSPARAPDVGIGGTVWPDPVYEYQSLLGKMDRPLPSGSEHFFQTYPSAPLDLGERQVLEDREMMPLMDDVKGGHYLLAGQTDAKHCHAEDLGYETMSPNDMEAV